MTTSKFFPLITSTVFDTFMGQFLMELTHPTVKYKVICYFKLLDMST